MLEQCHGVAQDLTKARDWYDQAPARGHAGARMMLATVHHGQGVNEDLNEAMRWFLKANTHGADVSRQIASVMGEPRRQNVQPQQISIPGPAPGSEVEVTGL